MVANVFRWRVNEVRTQSIAGGRYALCGLPEGRALTVAALQGRIWVRPAIVRITKPAPTAELDITIARD